MTEYGLDLMMLLAAALFVTGVFGVLSRRDIMFQLIALEVALTGPALAFIAGGAWQGNPEGQGMFMLSLTLAACEVPVGLALLLRIRRVMGTADSDAAIRLKG